MNDIIKNNDEDINKEENFKDYSHEIERIMTEELMIKQRLKKYGGNTGSILVNLAYSTPQLLDKFGFQKHGEIYPALKDKKVTDIGGGLGTMGFELQNSVSQINLVDPLFSQKDFDFFIDRDIKRLDVFIDETNDKYVGYNKKYNELENEMISEHRRNGLQFQLQDVARMASILQSTLNRYKEIKKDIFQRNDKEKKLSDKVKKMANMGEFMNMIPDSSQDYVFINFVLDKNIVNPELIIKEALKKLKPGGKLLSMNNKDNGLENFLKKQKIDYTMIDVNIFFTITKK